MKPAVFFDRDGTLMEEVDYCREAAKVRVYPGVIEALAALRHAGFRLIVITNQSGLARGKISWADYARVSHEFLRQCDFQIDATYFCPESPDGASARRKPAPGMLEEAIQQWHLAREESWMIGDKLVDLECARAAGIRSLLVRTGYGESTFKEPAAAALAEGIFPDVVAASEFVLARSLSKRGAVLA